MQYPTIDSIIYGLLLKRRYPIHFYVEFFMHLFTGYQELYFDTIGNIQPVLLTIDANGEAPAPIDMIDWIRLGVINGAFTRPMIQRTMNRLPNLDSNGAQIPYPGTDYWNGIADYMGFTVTFNSYGEYIGRNYGGALDRVDSFQYIAERNVFMFHPNLGDKQVYLEYVSDGSAVNLITKIHPYAKTTLENYMIWQHKEAGRSYSLAERSVAKGQFEESHALLRARLDDMTVDDFKHALYKNARSGPR